MKSERSKSVSIALCTYNGGQYLGEQLDTLNSQTLIPNELIVCDDNSSDNTVGILEAFSQIARFPVHIYVNDTNLGVTGNFEKCISLCKGGLIAPCDQDDVWLPGKLERLARVMDENPCAGYVFCDAELVDENLRSLGRRLWDENPNPFTPRERRGFSRGEQFPLLLKKNVVTGSCMMFRASLLPKVLPIPDPWIHDYWIASIAAAFGHRGLLVNEPLIKYRQHEDQQVGILKGTFLSKVRLAVKQWPDIAERDRKRMETLHTRLAELAAEEKISDTVAAKRRFLEARSRRLSQSPLSRAVMAGTLLVKGDYGRYSPYGWRAFLMDILSPTTSLG